MSGGRGAAPVAARRVLAFVLRVGVLYLLLSLLWPAIERPYGNGFRAVGNRVFGDFTENTSTVFRRFPERPKSDVKVVLRAQGLPGTKPVVAMDSERVGWFATAFLLALFLATPGARSLLRWRLPAALLLVHGFILLRIYLALLHGFSVLFGRSPPVDSWIPLPVLDMSVLWVFDERHSSYLVGLVLWGLLAFQRDLFTEALPPTPSEPVAYPPAGPTGAVPGPDARAKSPARG